MAPQMSQMAAGAPPATTGPPIITQQVFVVLLWVFFGLATIGLVFRFYIRFKCFRKLLADDYLVGFAWFLLLMSACIWYMTIDNMYELTHVSAGMAFPSTGFFQNAHRFLVGSNVALIMFYVGLWSIKLSFLIFFYRLGNHMRTYQIFWWIVLAFTVASGIACLGDIQYHCLSDPMIKVLMNCSSEAAIRFQEITIKVNCALDVVTDVMIMALPISILWSIHVSFGRKLLLAGLFSLVVITIVFAIVRVTVVSAGYTNSHHQAEISWLYFWSFMEFAVAVIVACLASFRALFTQKKRESEAEELKKREIIQREESDSKGRAMWARAKHFQQSLLETMNSDGLAGTTQATNDLVPLNHVSLSDHGLLDETYSLKTVSPHTVTSHTATSHTKESTADWV